jgi:ankyrin repeat protein
MAVDIEIRSGSIMKQSVAARRAATGGSMPSLPIDLLKEAVFARAAAQVREILETHTELRLQIDDPLFPFDSPAIVYAAGHGDRAVVDVLLSAGANINARSRWWAGGFGVLDGADPELASYLIERGAIVDAHAAARLGMLDELRSLVMGQPGVVHARGGDGKTPLHCSSTVEIAEYLLAAGADIDALDIDHDPQRRNTWFSRSRTWCVI